MQYRTPKDFSGIGALAMLFVFLIGGFILAGLAQGIIGYMMVPSGTAFAELPDAMMKAMLNPANVGLMRLSQVLGTLFLLFMPAALYSLVVNGKSPFWLGFNEHINIKQIAVGFFIIFLGNMLAAPVSEWSKWAIGHFPQLDTMAQKMEDTYNEQVLALSNLKSWAEYLVAIIIMAFFPALFEELFFRGALQNLFEKWWKKPLLAIVVTAIIFSLIHFSIYNFLTRVILGFVLGYMYFKTRNIWVNIVAHFLNNAIAVTQMFVLSRQNKKIDVNELDMKAEWWLGIVALAGLYFLFKLLERISAQNRARIIAREQVLLAKNDPFHSFANQKPPTSNLQPPTSNL